MIDKLTVKTAANLINAIDPTVAVVASGASLKAGGGGLNVLNGCEGTDVAFFSFWIDRFADMPKPSRPA